MSPGPAAVLRLANGRQVFVKAVAASASSASHRFYRQEAVALAALPPGVPAPELIGAVEVDEWCALVMSVAAGVPAGPPWTDSGVRLVAAACETIAAVEAPPVLPPIAGLLTDLDGWHRLRTEHPDLLDPWEREHARALADRAAGWPEWTAGQTLVHQDIRADNAVLGAGGAVLVDWSFGCAGPAGSTGRGWPPTSSAVGIATGRRRPWRPPRACFRPGRGGSSRPSRGCGVIGRPCPRRRGIPLSVGGSGREPGPYGDCSRLCCGARGAGSTTQFGLATLQGEVPQRAGQGEHRRDAEHTDGQERPHPYSGGNDQRPDREDGASGRRTARPGRATRAPARRKRHVRRTGGGRSRARRSCLPP
ncbi:hypothetical protein Aab01nite_75330 [Paractinoplanes abujensis]|uniref:Aminoglycoside phosphotransferase domain-containing protein n=1 Tax=Paractinoplanes abujensis TaxID=882441 RepID=A0A7W7CXR3_9ACTN|nr:phosphotransferase [Actinoplanes abujensis]MBB4695208.1 hypothetical protein [Actinoplanes abujensis]GID23943.1 hypothetical protein Aab01nite_75330 [Actinoplanes abujensis]